MPGAFENRRLFLRENLERRPALSQVLMQFRLHVRIPRPYVVDLLAMGLDVEQQWIRELLTEMVDDFIKDCDRRQAPKDFRIHWDGDFFSNDYAMAWRMTMESRPEVNFWVYTRTVSAARLLKGTPNLSLYFSADNENMALALMLRREGIKLAYLANTFQEGQAKMKEATGKPGAKCPENTRQIPLISTNGSACMACQLCPKGKADIVFSASKS
jgi:hypothetical protein